MRHAKKRKKSNSVFQAAGVLMLSMLLSRLLGFVRDIVITSHFSLDFRTDAYYAAFTIPDLIYFALVGGALSSAFIPVFSGYLAKHQEEDGAIVASTILNIVSLAAVFLIALGMIFTRQLVGLLVQFEGETFELTVLLTRVMFIQSFFMCLTGISQGILQSYKQFSAPALGAIVYNIATIVVGLLFYDTLGIMGFSIGVVVGAVCNLLVQIPPLIRYGFRYRPVMALRHSGVKQFFVLLLPVFLGLSVNELNLLVNQYLGSGLEESAISALKQAQRIMMLPVGIFAAAIGLSVFPTMTTHVARGEMDRYKYDLTMGLRTILFITLPAMAGLIVLRVPIVRAMYLQMAFTQTHLDMVATLLFFYCLGIVGYSAQQILNRGYYAISDTKTPVTINMGILLLNIVLSILLVGPLAERGLALAYSLSGLVSMIVLYLGLQRKIGSMGSRSLLKSSMQSLLASLLMAVVVSFAVQGLENLWDMSNKLAQVGQVLIGICLGALVYAAAAVAMRMEETRLFFDLVKKRLKR